MSNQTAGIPISLTDRISDILDRDESLVEVLAQLAPHLAGLRDPSKRRAMSRLVTVEQAAATAGIPADKVLAELNGRLGLKSSKSGVTASPPRSAANAEPPVGAKVVTLDLREDLRNGQEPFGKIMAAVGALSDDEVLVLLTTFEPMPLFAVLGKRGFEHHSEQNADDDWTISFWQATAGHESDPAVPSKSSEPEIEAADSGEIWLDVRGMEPPEPMVRTLAALEEMPEGKVLVHVNVRVPQFLLPILVERGFEYQIDSSDNTRVLVRISRQGTNQSPQTDEGDGNVSTATRELDVRVIPPRDKHPSIFRTLDELGSGESLMLINDHDPKPLRYQLDAERPDSYDWQYVAEGPEEWRVRITRH